MGTQIIRVTCPIQFKARDTVRIKVPAYPVSPLMEGEGAQVRRFVGPRRTKVGNIETVPPGVKPGALFPLKLDGQPEFRCPLTHRPGMSLRFYQPKVTRETVLAR